MTQGWLARAAVLLAVFAFLSVLTGTAVTNNPERPFYAFGQSHVWIGAAVALLTVAVVVGIHAGDEPLWLRRVAEAAMAAVAAQVVLGLQPLPQAPAVRIAHASLAQLLFPATVVIALCTAQWWKAPAKRVAGPSALGVLAGCTPVAVLAQVGLGTCFRHGVLDLGPHLIGAFLVAFFILGMALAVIYGTEHEGLRLAARVFLGIAALQIFLGFTLLTMQAVDANPQWLILVTIFHAATGALTLAATLALALLIRRGIYARSGHSRAAAGPA